MMNVYSNFILGATSIAHCHFGMLCGAYDILCDNIAPMPEKNILLGFLAVQFATLSTGYPLIFHGLGLMMGQYKSPQLRVRFKKELSIFWLGWCALGGTLFTGITLLLAEDRKESWIWYYMANITSFWFLLTTCLLFAAIGTLIKYVSQPWKVANSVKFYSPNKIRRIFNKSNCQWFRIWKPKLSWLVKKYRNDCTLIAEQIRIFAELPGNENVLQSLNNKLLEGMSKDMLLSLYTIEVGEESTNKRKTSSNQAGSVSKALMSEVLDSIRQAYISAKKVYNRTAKQILSKTIYQFSIEYSRLGGEKNCENMQFSQEICSKLLDSILELSKKDMSDEQSECLSLASTIYTDAVFLPYSDIFNIQLIGQFDIYFIKIARAIVTSQNAELGQSFMGFLNDGPRFSPFSGGSLKTIPFKYREIQDYLNNSKCNSKKIECIYSHEDLSVFKKFWEEVLNKIPEDVRRDIEFAEWSAEVINSANGWMKLNHLRECLFELGAWCLMKAHYPFLRTMWEIHQPPDTAATYGENTLFPGDIRETLKHYFFVQQPHDREIDFNWEGHRGKGIWFRQYVILHLLAASEGRLEDVSWKSDETPEIIAQEMLEGLDSNKLKSIEYDTESLISVANNLESNRKLLNKLGFSLDKGRNPIKDKVLPLLEALLMQTKNNVGNMETKNLLDKREFDSFTERASEGYILGLRLARINVQAGQPIGHSVSAELSPPTPIVNLHWMPRGAFIKDWYVDCSSLGPGYGSELARQVDYQILTHMSRIAQRMSYDEFKAKCVQKGPELILISAPMALGYRSVWREEFEFDNDTPDTMESFGPDYRGQVRIGKRDIRVFAINSPIPLPFPQSSVLVLPPANLGTIKTTCEKPNNFNSTFDTIIGADERKAWLGIRDLEDEEIHKLLEESPYWLIDKAGESKEEQAHWLRRHTILGLSTKLCWTYYDPKEILLVSPK